MEGSFRLSWRLLNAMLGLCWGYVEQSGALLAASEGYAGPFEGYVGIMLGNFRFCCCFFRAMLGHLEAMLGLC